MEKKIINIKNISKTHNFSGYASIFNVKDLQKDVILRGAFGAVDLSKIKLLLNHDFTKEVGLITALQEDSKGLYISGETSISVVRGMSLSIGFFVQDFWVDSLSGIRFIKRADLREVSFVNKGANVFAKIF
jgi:HK97 family phage prohead protease